MGADGLLRTLDQAYGSPSIELQGSAVFRSLTPRRPALRLSRLSLAHCLPVSAMAVPKRRQSNARTGTRRAHDQKKPRQLHYCPKCSTAVPSHVICPNCGYYMGRVVVESEDVEETP